MVFGFNLQTCTLTANDMTVPILLVGANADPYFRANDVAAVLGYTQPAVAISKILKGKNVKTLEELYALGLFTAETSRQSQGVSCAASTVQQGLSVVTNTPRASDQNVLKTRYINEPGLYRLVGSSKLPLAEAFQDWVYTEVLPSIRKTGRYETAPAKPADRESWEQGRLNGIEVNKLKCAKLKEIIAACFKEKDAVAVYKIVNNLCNQAVLGFRESTRAFKKKRDYPDYMSIADFMDPFGQVVRCATETAFYKYIIDNMEELKTLPQWSIVERFEGLSSTLAECHRKTGFADLQNRLLTIQEAKALKKKLAADRRAGLLQISPAISALDLERSSP